MLYRSNLIGISPKSLGLLFAAILIGSTACSRYPKGPEAPKMDPEGAGKEAMQQYDKNSDGGIDKTEVESSPGLKAAFERVDKDKDGKLSASEIADRVRFYRDCGVSVVSGSTRITFRSRPLPGATVTFEPEPFLGPAFEKCEGVTGSDGVASVSRKNAQFPGLYLGFYRVRVSTAANGKELVPAKFNTDSMLGYEAATEIPGMSNIMQFEVGK